MTKNFLLLKQYDIFDFEVQNKLIICVEEIEEVILGKTFKDIKYILQDVGTILEEILAKEVNVDDKMLFDLVTTYIDMNGPSSKVKNALHDIKNLRNDSSHRIKEADKIFLIQHDNFSLVSLLSSLYIIVVHFAIVKKVLSFEEIKSEFQMDRSIYEKKESKIVQNLREDVAPESTSLISTTRGIFEILSSENNFFIPTYQRSYEWDIDQIDVLLNDILNRMEDRQTHYMGSLAMSYDPKNKFSRLIDGQQRITSSLLLIKAIIEFYLNKNIPLPKELTSIKELIKTKYINNTNITAIEDIKIILKRTMQTSGISKPYKNIEYIKVFLENEIGINKVDDFLTTFIHKFVVAELVFPSELTNEIQIFENLNSKGLALTQWDLIKNYIFKVIDTSLLLSREQEIEKLITKYFLIKTNTATSNNDNTADVLSDFFKVYSQIQHKIIFGKELDSSKGQSARIFAKVWPIENKVITSYEKLELELKEISRFLDVFLHLETEKWMDKSSPLFDSRLALLNTKQHGVKNALVTYLIYKNAIWSEIDSTSLVKIKNPLDVFEFLDSIEKYITRLFVTNPKKQSLTVFFDSIISKEYMNMMAVFYKKIREFGQMKLPSLKDFGESVESDNRWSNELAKSVLRRIEANEYGPQRELIILSPQLEHIMPQSVSKTSPWFEETKMQYRSFLRKHDEFLRMIGNMTITSQAINLKASNNDFRQKQIKYKQDAHSVLMNGKFNKHLITNVLEKNSWTFNDIKLRSKELSIFAQDAYRMPDE